VEATHRYENSGRKVRRGPKLRAASFDDFAEIAALASRGGLSRPNNYEEWSHLWLGNPLYRERRGDWSIGWVLEDPSGRIVGSMENIPLPYEFQGRRIIAVTGRGWVADPEYRSASLLLLDNVINQPDVDLYLNSTFSPASTPAITVFGCSRVPVGIWDESAFWVADHQGFLASFLSRKGYPLARPLSYPGASAMLLRERLTRAGLRASDVEVEACSIFDERFDEFWADLRTRQSHLLLAIRTREVLAWHFKYALSNNRAWIATVVDSGRIIAYAVFDRRDRTDIALRRARLVDYQSLDGSTDFLLPLLSWGMQKCRAEGVHMLEHVGRWLEDGEIIDLIAPYRRRLLAWRYAYRANNPELAEGLRERRAWAPSLFDGDASLTR
jgi:hypothetical protein